MSCFSSWFGFITDLHMRAHKLFASAIRSSALREQHKGWSIVTCLLLSHSIWGPECVAFIFVLSDVLLWSKTVRLFSQVKCNSNKVLMSEKELGAFDVKQEISLCCFLKKIRVHQCPFTLEDSYVISYKVPSLYDWMFLLHFRFLFPALPVSLEEKNRLLGISI